MTSPPYDPSAPFPFMRWTERHLRDGDTIELAGAVATLVLVGDTPDATARTLRVPQGAVAEVTDGGRTWRALDGDPACRDVLDTATRLQYQRLYLAGPMTGYPHFNYPAFNDTAAALREVGYDVLNPASNAAQPSWDAYLRQALHQVLSADAVALLPGWEASAGARLEVHVAHQLRMTTLPFHLWLERAHLVEVGR